MRQLQDYRQPQHTDRSAGVGRYATGSPGCPAATPFFTHLLTAMRVALASALQNVFFIGFVLALVVTLFLREIPLRKRHLAARPEPGAPESEAPATGPARTRAGD